MKLTSLLTRASGLAGAAFVLGVAFDSHSLALFSTATGAFLLLTFASDYAEQPLAAEPGRTATPGSRNDPSHALRLAI